MDLSNSLNFFSINCPLGCDVLGKSITDTLLVGTLYSVSMYFIISFLTLSFALFTATLFSFANITFERIFYRIIDIMLSFPGFLLALLLASFLPPNPLSIIFSLTLTGWAAPARFFHSLIKNNLNKEFVESAFATGATKKYIFFHHIFPIILPQIITQFFLSISHNIIAESSLSFIGLGPQSQQFTSLGRLIADGRIYMLEAPHLSLYPGMILITLLIILQKLAKL